MFLLQAYLETRTRVLQMADNDTWHGPARSSRPRGGASFASRVADDREELAEPEDMPSLVLMPDGREIFIAKKEAVDTKVDPLPFCVQH